MKKIPVFESKFTPTPVYRCNGQYTENEIYIKRDDLLPFSFGGNKVRKAQKFYGEIMEQKPDVLVTYGSSSSNHCRIIANLAKALGISCEIISPKENKHETPNSKIVANLGAKVRYCAVNQVKETIDKTMEELAVNGKPYFIMGGGHGNPGTEGYKDAYEEIVEYEKEHQIQFDENTKFGEDREFNWKYLCHCKTAAWIDLPMYGYRINAQSATQRTSTWRKTDLLAAVKRIEAYLAENKCEYSEVFNSYMYARSMWAVAKTFAVSKNTEQFSRLMKEYDVKTCMKRTAKDSSKLVAIASWCYLINPWLFFRLIGLKG